MAFNRDSSLDIALSTGSWRGGASDGITLWFVDDFGNMAVAYVAATRARDSAKDISLGTGFWRGGALPMALRSGLWITRCDHGGCLRGGDQGAGFS